MCVYSVVQNVKFLFVLFTLSFQMILPKVWPDSRKRPVCVHLAGTGDHVRMSVSDVQMQDKKILDRNCILFLSFCLVKLPVQ